MVHPPSVLSRLPPHSDSYRWAINQEVSVPSEGTERLTEALRNDPALHILRRTVVQNSPFSTVQNQDWFERIAHWLLAQSCRRTPEDVIEQLEAFVSTNHIRMQEVLALWGIHPSRPIDLYQGIKLVPLRSLPPSDWRDALLGEGFDPVGLAMHPRASAALVSKLDYGPILRSSSDPEAEAARATTRLELKLEIARCLILVDDSPVSPMFNFYQSDETAPLVGGPTSSSGWGFKWAHTFDFPPDTTLDENSMKTLIGSYFGLDEATRGQLRVPLTRLQLSMLESNNIDDKAIDLGIALEALLTSDRESNAPRSYLVRHRGTLLLSLSKI